MSPIPLLGAVLLVVGFTPDAPTPADGVRADYEQRRAAAPRDADAQVKLALWCEAVGLERERARHLAMAALADPDATLARSLMGQVRDGDAWRTADEVARRAAEDADRVARLADYRDRRASAKDTADDHAGLARWCEANALADEATAHWRAVVRLDPTRDAAWKKLGAKKVDGRWLTDAQIDAAKADRDAQKAADRRWESTLTTLKASLRGKSTDRRKSAARELADVDDPRAVPSVLKVFVLGKDADPALGVQLLGQIDAAASSRALARIALGHDVPTVRAQAGQALQSRDPREFADLLVASLQDMIKHRVERVGGPGSPGFLAIASKGVDIIRRYAPPAGPTVLPGDRFGVGEDGFVYADRFLGINKTEYSPAQLGFDVPWQGANALGIEVNPIPFNDVSRRHFASVLGTAGFSASESQQLIKKGSAALSISRLDPNLSQLLDFADSSLSLMPPNKTTMFGYTAERLMRVPIGRAQAEAETSAAIAQGQLKADVGAIHSMNDAIREWNERALMILNGIGFDEPRKDRAAWVAWYTDLVGYAYIPEPIRRRQTVYEDVPLAYEPGPVPTPVFEGKLLSLYRISCFAAGTSVRTLDGPRPIESLEVGDRVLAEDTATGAIAYKPVTVMHRNPPSKTLVVRAGGDEVTASTFHRFWVAGRGWVMARDLKAGDPIRTLRGTAAVESVEPGATMPVFNLDVADAATFFVGDAALLVHDNTLPDHRARPFDALATADVAR